jgi:hypothetical protein
MPSFWASNKNVNVGRTSSLAGRVIHKVIHQICGLIWIASDYALDTLTIALLTIARRFGNGFFGIKGLWLELPARLVAAERTAEFDVVVSADRDLEAVSFRPMPTKRTGTKR